MECLGELSVLGVIIIHLCLGFEFSIDLFRGNYMEIIKNIEKEKVNKALIFLIILVLIFLPEVLVSLVCIGLTILIVLVIMGLYHCVPFLLYLISKIINVVFLCLKR